MKAQTKRKIQRKVLHKADEGPNEEENTEKGPS
jgi:hypothetical protein